MAVSSDHQSSSSQWIFSVSALLLTPSLTTSNFTLERELYDRSRGAEFLFRLGSSLGLLVFVAYLPCLGLCELRASDLLFPQAIGSDVHCCDVVSPFLHALLIRGLSSSSKPWQSNVVRPVHRRTVRMSPLRVSSSLQRLKNVEGSYVMSPGCVRQRSPTRKFRLSPLMARYVKLILIQITLNQVI
jgi:hypothetical protein